MGIIKPPERKIGRPSAQLTRRQALSLACKAGAGALALSGIPGLDLLLAAESPTPKAAAPFHWARAKFDILEDGNGWDAHPFGDTYFLTYLKKTTNINVDTTWRYLMLDNLEEMCKYSMIFFTAEGHFRFSEAQRANIREYVERGGFIYADDCVLRINGAKTGDHFFQSFKTEIEKIFQQPMVRLPNEHALYHCLYDLDGGAPFMQGTDRGGYALVRNGRAIIFITSGDIHCGWCGASGLKGQWFTPAQREDALKMGVNMVVYMSS